MVNVTKKTMGLVLGSILVFSTSMAMADEVSTNAEDLGGVIKVSAQTKADFFYNNSTGDYLDNLNNKANVKISAQLSKQIKLVIGLELKSKLRANGDNTTSDFDIEKFLKEAYIEIKNIDGVPVAFVVGKHKIAFGQDFSDMPGSDLGPLHNTAKMDQVMGVTVSLDKLPFFDLVQISGFETGAGDLKIGDLDGASIRLTKNITDQIKAQASYMHAGNGTDDDEDRVSVGLIYDNGDWTAWIEGIYTNGNSDFDHGVSGGASKKVGPGRVVVEATYLHDALTQYGVGYKFMVGKNLEFGPEVRYVDYADGRDSETQILIRAKVKFDPIVVKK
jgi:hypothetical protein